MKQKLENIIYEGQMELAKSLYFEGSSEADEAVFAREYAKEATDKLVSIFLDSLPDEKTSVGFPSYDPERTPKFKYDRKVESFSDEGWNDCLADIKSKWEIE